MRAGLKILGRRFGSVVGYHYQIKSQLECHTSVTEECQMESTRKRNNRKRAQVRSRIYDNISKSFHLKSDP